MLSGFFEGVDELIGSWNLNVQDQVLAQKNDITFTMSFVKFYMLIFLLLLCIINFCATFGHCSIICDTLGAIVPYVGGYSRGGVCNIQDPCVASP